eukprot:NODE_3754_length_735_cov_67.023324_g526_i1.p2 GENE.NODE_3754_length_735_cov_67.023324_g526_i1~~NODE_3754_length_735_cov_67.023324_g526_i1.p2  ORF type:complete len:103 (+),score=34.31 NODE_3754_length_735_cov_67.023324_g526_i1:313-621(+)
MDEDKQRVASLRAAEMQACKVPHAVHLKEREEETSTLLRLMEYKERQLEAQRQRRHQQLQEERERRANFWAERRAELGLPSASEEEEDSSQSPRASHGRRKK